MSDRVTSISIDGMMTSAQAGFLVRAVRERLGDTGSPNTIHKHLATWREARPVAVAAASVLPQALTAAIAAEIERAASQARGEIEGRLVQVKTEAAELAVSGEATEAERDALAEQVAALTTERDTLTGRAAQQAADLAEQARRIEREQQAAEAARVELATARLKIEAQAEARADQSAEIERLRAALLGTIDSAPQPTVGKFAVETSLAGSPEPVLEGAAVAFDCRIVDSQPKGTHSVLFCEVLATRLSDQPGGLIWFNRAFHPLEARV